MTGIPALVQQLAVYTSDGDRVGPCLLSQLNDAVVSNVGRTKGGASSPSQRIALDADAYELREDIFGRIASMYNTATDLRTSRSARFDLLAWANEFEAAIDRDDVTDMQLVVAMEELEHMIVRIKRHFDRPVQKDIAAPCPRCGVRHVTRGQGEEAATISTLQVSYRVGEGVSVVCANCTAAWSGNEEVIRLGGLIGMVIDPDAIRAALEVVEEEV